MTAEQEAAAEFALQELELLKPEFVVDSGAGVIAELGAQLSQLYARLLAVLHRSCATRRRALLARRCAKRGRRPARQGASATATLTFGGSGDIGVKCAAMNSFTGSGPGPQTRDGCSVELYRQLPYMGELEPVRDFLVQGATVLELGCGSGRLTRVLIDRGLVPTCVDNSPEMLALLPPSARAVISDIEDLRLNSTFDVVLLASHLINHPAEDVRRAFVRCAYRHAHDNTRVLIHRHDPQWLRSVTAGFEARAGELLVCVEAVEREPSEVSMTLRYSLAGEVWRQSFSAVPLDDAQIGALLAAEGLGVSGYAGPRHDWIVARRQR